MIDLNKYVPDHGAAGSRGMEVVKLLRESGHSWGYFNHHGVEIVCYPNSTEREIQWQWEAKTLARK